MGQAGPEAVMPLKRGAGGLAVGAIGMASETALPLARLGSGRLGVQLKPFALGDVFGVPPRLANFASAAPAAAPLPSSAAGTGR